MLTIEQNRIFSADIPPFYILISIFIIIRRCLRQFIKRALRASYYISNKQTMTKTSKMKSVVLREIISKEQQKDIKGGALSTEDKKTKRTTTTTPIKK